MGRLNRLVCAILLLFIGTVGASAAPVATRQAAVAVLLASKSLPAGAPFQVYAAPQVLAAGAVLSVGDPSQPGGKRVLRTLTAPAWLLYVDLAPGLYFEHPTRFVLIDAASGQMTSFDAQWWPTVNGVDRWVTLGERNADRVLGQKGGPPKPKGGGAGGGGAGGGGVPPSTSGEVPSYCGAAPLGKWALVISGDDDGIVDPNETNRLAGVLRGAGYAATHLQPNGFDKGWATVAKQIADFGARIRATPNHGYCNEALIVWQSHGSRDGYIYVRSAKGGRSWIKMQALVDAVEGATNRIEGLQLRLVVQTCYAGRFVTIVRKTIPPDPHLKTDFQNIRDVLIVTSSRADEPSVATQPGVDSFLNAWTKCLQGGKSAATAFSCGSNVMQQYQTPLADHWYNNGA